MISTLDLGDLTRYADSVYEAIVVIARRARQINDEQRMLWEKTMDYSEMADEFEEEDYTQKEHTAEELKLPKPPSLALEEYLKGELIIEYADESVV